MSAQQRSQQKTATIVHKAEHPNLADAYFQQQLLGCNECRMIFELDQLEECQKLDKPRLLKERVAKWQMLIA
jgi:hypothetical protein